MRQELFTCSLRANRWVHSPPCLRSLLPFLSYLDFSCNMMYIGFNCNIIGWNKSSYLACVCVLSHVRLCGRMDYSPPGLSVHGINISQARILEWVAIPFSRGSSQPRDRTHVSCVSFIGRRTLPLSHQGSPLGDCIYSDAAFLSWNISGIPVREIVCVCWVVVFCFFKKLYLAVADLQLSF